MVVFCPNALFHRLFGMKEREVRWGQKAAPDCIVLSCDRKTRLEQTRLSFNFDEMQLLVIKPTQANANANDYGSFVVAALEMCITFSI